MTKSVSLTYGNIELPSNVVLGQVCVELYSDAGGFQSRQFVPFGTPSVDVIVPSGSWFIRVWNCDSGLGHIGNSIDTAVFEVAETQMVSLVIGASL
jgi:hypothetical protein